MITLHIEHPITDFTVWRGAFDRFAAARRQAGVRAEQVRRPVDDPAYVVIDLGFDSADAAGGFLDFLRSAVWASTESSPALAGTPQTLILEDAPVR